MTRLLTFVQVCFFAPAVAFRPKTICCMTVYRIIGVINIRSLEQLST